MNKKGGWGGGTCAEVGSMMWMPSIGDCVQWFPVPGRNIVLVNPCESERREGSVSEEALACACVRSRVHACARLRCCFQQKLSSGDGEGQRKQDANEPALINVCLISYSALSGRGKDRGGERRERWETVGWSSWESAGPTSDSLPLLRALVLRNPSVNADMLRLRRQSGRLLLLDEQLRSSFSNHFTCSLPFHPLAPYYLTLPPCFMCSRSDVGCRRSCSHGGLRLSVKANHFKHKFVRVTLQAERFH